MEVEKEWVIDAFQDQRENWGYVVWIYTIMVAIAMTRAEAERMRGFCFVFVVVFGDKNMMWGCGE
jgi:hypothetical protein